MDPLLSLDPSIVSTAICTIARAVVHIVCVTLESTWRMRYTTIPSTSVSSHALADLLIGEQLFEKELKRLWLLSALSSTSASSFAAKSNKTGVPSKFFSMNLMPNATNWGSNAGLIPSQWSQSPSIRQTAMP